MKRTALFWSVAMVVCCFVGSMLMVGCEEGGDGDGGVNFSNESTKTVTVRAWDFFDHSDEFVLAPGDDENVSFPNPLNAKPHVVNYDWSPKDTVGANRVDDTHVVFVNK